MTRSDTAAAVLQDARTAALGRADLFRLFWLFLLSGFLGDLVEMAFWLVTRGELISRSSLVYGPFSMVWGLGALLFTLTLRPLAGHNCLVLFTAGTLLGGVYEYLCSWFQELAFGACFWDYSHLPLNLNGRVNLVFCLFWGLAAVAWAQVLLPLLCLFIQRLRLWPFRRWLTGALAVLLLLSTALSAAALVRMDRRRAGVPASNSVEVYLDQHFPDQRLRQRYPNMGLLPQ